MNDIKNRVLGQISSGQHLSASSDRAIVTIAGKRVHVRFCSTNGRAPGKFKFNINPNTLTADFELWICGGSDVWYLIPIETMTSMYQHPDSYVDSRHPAIRIVSVDAQSHRVTYARGGVSAELCSFRQAQLAIN